MNINIRRAMPDDAEAIQRIFDGPRAVYGTLQLPYTAIESRRQRLIDISSNVYPLVAAIDGEVVGQLTLRTFPDSPRRRHAGSIGMAVRDDWQGKGIGSALMKACIDLAENWLNLTRLELTVFTDNEAGIRLYRKSGFEIEGTQKQFAYRQGEYVDAYLMACLR